MAANEQAALVVRLEAKFDKLEKQLKDVGVLAEKSAKGIEDSFSKINPDVFKGTFLGTQFSSLIDRAVNAAIAKFNELKEKLVELQNVADFTGQSLKDMAAAQIALGDPDKFAAGVEKLLVLLDRARRGEKNPLSEILKLNDIDIKNLQTAEDVLLAINTIMAGLTKFESRELGERLGLTRGMQEALQNTKDLAQKIADVKQNADELVHQPLQSWAERLAEAEKKVTDEIAAGNKQWENFQNLNVAKSLGDAAVAAEILRQKLSELPQVKAMTSESTNVGERFPTAVLATKPLSVKTEETEKKAQLSSLQRLVIEQEKQTNLAKSELQLVSATNTARAVGRAEVEAQAAIQKDVERGLKIAPALIEERTKKIRENAAAEAEYLQKIREVNDAVNTTKNIMSDALKTFVSALQEGKSAADAMRDSLKRVADLLLDKSINLALNMLVAGNTTGTGIGGPLGAGIAGLFPQRQHGGPVSAGRSYIVGENGPELVRFGRNGMVIPNAAVGSSGGGVSVQIINNGATVSQSSKRRSDGGTDLRVVIDAAVSDLASTPGTSTNRALRMGTAPLIRRS